MFAPIFQDKGCEMRAIDKLADRYSASSKLLGREVGNKRGMIYVAGLAVFGPMLFVGLNLVLYLRNPTVYGKPDMTMWLIGMLVISEAAGLLWSWIFVVRSRRMNKVASGL
jgi:hypothetical protein